MRFRHRRSAAQESFRLLGGRLGLATSLAFLGIGAAPAPEPLPLEAYARPGMLVTAPGGRKLNMRCVGKSGPTIILTAGAGDQSLTWRLLQSRLADRTRVCAWDRAGFGFSDPSKSTQDVRHRTDDLERILSGAGIRPPYLLVGHSLGSFETLMYAFRHTRAVAGIVLIDPSSPNQDDRLKQAAPAFYDIVDRYQKGALAALGKCIADAAGGSVVAGEGCVAAPSEDYPPALREALIRQGSRLDAKRNQLSLLEAMLSGADAKQLRAAWRPLGNMPVIVLTAGLAPPIPVEGKTKEEVKLMQAEWSKMHRELAGLSSEGIHRTVPGATHYIYRDKPEAAVDAIEEVLAVSRGKVGRADAAPDPRTPGTRTVTPPGTAF